MPGSPLQNEANRLLAQWPAPDAAQARLRSAFVRHIAGYRDSLLRTCADGHLTASAVVLDAPHEHVLLTLHPRLGRWIQMGGHIEDDDATVETAALREASEESGIVGLTLDPVPVDLDIHAFECPKGTPNRHLDVRFVATARQGAQPVCSDESLDVAWFALTALPRELDTSTVRLIARAAARVC